MFGEDGEPTRCDYDGCKLGKVTIRRCPYRLLHGSGAWEAIDAHRWIESGQMPFGKPRDEQTPRTIEALTFVRSEVKRNEAEEMKKREEERKSRGRSGR